ncbi:MAG: FAD-binding oxidoreductase [Pseudomonadales bacterium]
MTDLLDQLATQIGPENVSQDPSILASHGLDWTRFYEGDPLAVVFPRSVEMLQKIVQFAFANKIPMVPSGGRTGLSGGAVAAQRELVVSFDKMNKIGDFNEVERTVEVEAGVVTEALQNFASEHDLQYPVDFASSGSSQIGGNIATNAGGIKVVRYGLTRDWIQGLTVVTGRGEIMELNKGLVKNATGYDLRHLFIGSEGTLGFIAKATIALTDAPKNPEVLLLAVEQMTDVIKVLTRFRQNLTLNAFEFFSEVAIQHVLKERDAKHPFAQTTAYYVLLEFDNAAPEDMNRAMESFEFCLGEGWVSDGVVSQSESQRQELWMYREAISESITPHTPYKNDISVRIGQVPEFLRRVDELVNREYPEFEIVWFGHIGDGNVHLNILRPDAWDIADFKRECEQVSERVLALVAEFEGSVSAEHGVGLLKREQLKFSRSQEEIAMMRGIKQVFDPAGIMNPGKLLLAD